MILRTTEPGKLNCPTVWGILNHESKKGCLNLGDILFVLILFCIVIKVTLNIDHRCSFVSTTRSQIR